MEIKYLKNLNRARRINSRKNVGLSQAEISDLESDAPGSFPKAYKELLFIAGKSSGLFLDGWNFGTWDVPEENNIKDQQELAAEILSEEQFVMSDYWVIADLDSCEQFYFFQFNNTTGDDEDPPVFICDVGYWEPGEVEPGYEFARKVAGSISEFVTNWLNK